MKTSAMALYQPYAVLLFRSSLSFFGGICSHIYYQSFLRFTQHDAMPHTSTPHGMSSTRTTARQRKHLRWRQPCFHRRWHGTTYTAVSTLVAHSPTPTEHALTAHTLRRASPPSADARSSALNTVPVVIFLVPRSHIVIFPAHVVILKVILSY